MGSHPEGIPWVLVAEVLAEAAGVEPARLFDDQARALAKTMRGIRHDWAGRPCITWSVAAELLESLRAEAARKREASRRGWSQPIRRAWLRCHPVSRPARCRRA
jgi:hypothetical protein